MMNNAFQTLVEKADLLKRSDLMQLLQMSLKVNSMLNKVINKQENLRDKYNKKGASSGVPHDGSGQSADIDSPRDAEPRQSEPSVPQDSPADSPHAAEPRQSGPSASQDSPADSSHAAEPRQSEPSVPQDSPADSPRDAEPRQSEPSASQKSGCITVPLRGERQRDAGPEQDDLAASDKFSYSKVCREITKAVSEHRACAGDGFGKDDHPTVGRETEKIDSDTEDISLNRCTEKIPPAGAACWEQTARKNQLMPEGDWRIWMILAGRGFGKTRAAAEAIRKLALSGKYKRIALIANTIEEAKQVMVEGVSGLQNISQDSDGLTYTPSRRELRWKNGTIATLYGAENYQQLRGPQFDLAWVDEFAKFLYPRETFEQLSFALRMGDDPKLILTTTPRPIPFIKELMARDDVVTVRGSSLENEKNLSPTFLKHLEYLKGTRMEAQEIYAEIVEDNPNTLWSWRDIENCYRDPPHFIDNIIIGVDPATTGGENSDETGIIVVGKDCNGRAFVLEDASMRATPDVWAKKVADLYKRYRARKIVIEANAGGDLLDQVLLREDPSLKIKKVRARESKICRAQPVVILYQKNLVFHAKQFRELEMEMATYEPGQKSPDRMDALVWALTDLFEIEANDYVPRAFLI